MSTAKKGAFTLLSALFAATIVFNLGPVLLAGLFSYMILDLAHRRLSKRTPAVVSRGLAVLTFGVVAVVLAWMFWKFLRLALERIPAILTLVVPRIDALAGAYGFDLPFENLHELRLVIMDTVRENARSITQASGLLTKGFFQIVVGIFIAILCFLSREDPPHYEANLYDALRREFHERVRGFMRGFEKVIGAQVAISAINTVVTAIFLLAVGMPYPHFLILATFIFGVIPMVGTVASNVIVVGTALAVSPHLAVITLIFLVIAHKLQYFINSQIVGSRLNAPAWQVLLGILIGESLLGVPGMLLAPAVLHYAREELREIPANRKA